MIVVVGNKIAIDLEEVTSVEKGTTAYGGGFFVCCHRPGCANHSSYHTKDAAEADRMFDEILTAWMKYKNRIVPEEVPFTPKSCWEMFEKLQDAVYRPAAEPIQEKHGQEAQAKYKAMIRAINDPDRTLDQTAAMHTILRTLIFNYGYCLPGSMWNKLEG